MENELRHYGILGMKWGIRRYQPYSQVPRKSGKKGKFVGNRSVSERVQKNLDARGRSSLNALISMANKNGEQANKYFDKAVQEYNNGDAEKAEALVNAGKNWMRRTAFPERVISSFNELNDDEITKWGREIYNDYRNYGELVMMIRSGRKVIEIADFRKNMALDNFKKQWENTEKTAKSVVKKINSGRFDFTDEEKDKFYNYYDSVAEGDQSSYSKQELDELQKAMDRLTKYRSS